LGTTRRDGSAQCGIFRCFNTKGVPITTKITTHIARQDITFVIAAIAERKAQELPSPIEQEGGALLLYFCLAAHVNTSCHEKDDSHRVHNCFCGISNHVGSK
jgi:hypothetical protein